MKSILGQQFVVESCLSGIQNTNIEYDYTVKSVSMDREKGLRSSLDSTEVGFLCLKIPAAKPEAVRVSMEPSTF
jgi:hypothetical protein